VKLKLILTTAILGTALAVPSVSNAAPPPPTFQDSVSLTGPPAQVANCCTLDELSATSGPNGENPTGEVRFVGGPISDSGPVSCLAVSGNTATLNFASTFLGVTVTAYVVDGNPDTFAIVELLRAPTDCSPPEPTAGNPLTSGDIRVVDAQVPTMRAQCRNGGWQQFGFKNQGQCIAFVDHGS
jgi:hypothetical protein